MKRIAYKEGEKIGNCVFVRDTKTIIKIYNSKKHHIRYAEFICECGKLFENVIDSVKTGKVESCRCITIRKSTERLPDSTTHGLSKSIEYKIWSSMKSRCFNKRNAYYDIYGKRGISVCEEWKNSFMFFLKDMGKRPSVGYSIERIDVNGNYCPENCKWATLKEQNGNKRNSRLLTYKGKTQCLTYWAKEYNIKNFTLDARLKSGLSLEQALWIPVLKRGR